MPEAKSYTTPQHDKNVESMVHEIIHNMELPNSVNQALSVYEQLIPGLLEQGLEGHWVVVYSSGEYDSNDSVTDLEAKHESALNSGSAILRGIEPLTSFDSISFR